MRHAASATHPFQVGQLVVVAGRNGVWRVEGVVDEQHRRVFSYVDGAIVIAALEQLAPCPANTPAAG